MEVKEVIKVLKEVREDKTLKPELWSKVNYMIDDLMMYKHVVI